MAQVKEKGEAVRVLLLDDDASFCRAMKRLASSYPNIELVTVETVAAFRARMKCFAVDVVVSDFELGGGQTSAALVHGLLVARVPVLVLTGNVQCAIEAVGVAVPVFAKSSDVAVLFAEIERHRTRSTGGLRVERRDSSV